MKAWMLSRISNLETEKNPLDLVELPVPQPVKNEILIKVDCCGICHTELDEIEGRTAPPFFPVIPGHQVIGTVVKNGSDAIRFTAGERVGVAWIFSACGNCEYCLSGQENLCARFKATGRDAHGGYADYMVIDEKFAVPIPKSFTSTEAAPLLCAGAIGFRSLKLTNLQNGQPLALAGFGASGHLVLKMAKGLYPDSPVLVFARSPEEQRFAKSLGAYWAGTWNDPPPMQVQSIIDTTPAWKPVIDSLLHLKPGGRLVINAIRKETADISYWLNLRYPEHLWMEKEIKSVANITRQDVSDFLELASVQSIKPEVELYPFNEANQALIDLKQKHIKGAKVLLVS
jgi:propanol-preferring alcohol dehydrogenase